MTREQLQSKLQEICEEHIEILDVFFYKKDKKQMIVVPYIASYKVLSSSMSVRQSATIEDILMQFYDSKRLGTVSLDMGSNIPSANAMIEEL